MPTTGPKTLAKATGGLGANAGPPKATGGLGANAGPPRPRRQRDDDGESEYHQGQGFEGDDEGDDVSDCVASRGINYRWAVAEARYTLYEWSTLPDPWKTRLKMSANKVAFAAIAAEESSDKRESARWQASRPGGAVAPAAGHRRWAMTKRGAEMLR